MPTALRPPRSNPIHVLHVDDDRSATLLVSRMLRAAGYRVTVAGGLEEALAAVASDSPDVVVSDLLMGEGGDGFTLVAALKQIGAACPVVMLTSVDEASAVAIGRQLGVARFLTKPVGTDTLVDAIEAVLHRPERRTP